MLASRFLSEILILGLVSACSATEIKNSSAVRASEPEKCALINEPPKKEPKTSYLISREHTSRLQFKGYVSFSYESDTESDLMRYLPLNFTQLAVLSNQTTGREVIYLTSECATMAITLNGHEYTTTDGANRVYKFEQIQLTANGMNRRCTVKEPQLDDFLDNQFYSCYRRKMLECEFDDIEETLAKNKTTIRSSRVTSTTDAPQAIDEDSPAPIDLSPEPLVHLIFQQLEFEIHGEHNHVFDGRFSKRRKLCSNKQRKIVSYPTTTERPCYRNGYY